MQIWSIRDLTDHVKALLENDVQLAGLVVRGEISNFTRSVNGHCYFVLKDEHSQVNSVMFKGSASRLAFAPQNGMKVIALGRVTLYEQRGQYQLMVSELKLDGLGELYAAFLQLKERLAKEGLFEAARKRRVPVLPRRVGLVTSPTGAALQDMLTTMRRRHAGVDIVLSPALVQGTEAPASIVAALRRLYALQGTPDAVDAIIVARGGGSFEELNAFNDETVARTVVASPVPLVSGVGHETDTTIIDLVADVRAATPTAAAALVTPDRAEALRALSDAQMRLRQSLLRRLERARERLAALERRGWRLLPARILADRRQQLDEVCAEMVVAVQRGLERRRVQLRHEAARLDALSPLKVLARGYAVCRTPDGQVVTRVEQARVGQDLEVRVQDGTLGVTVREIAMTPAQTAVAVAAN